MDDMDTKKKPKICYICGVKNTGKTTLMAALIQELSGRSLNVAAIKHDGHDFTADTPETDTFRYDAAGAVETAIYSQDQVMIHKRNSGDDDESLIALFSDADVILVEGCKEKSVRKIECLLSGVQEEPVSNRDGRILLVCDEDLAGKADFMEPVLPSSDVSAIADRILADDPPENELIDPYGRRADYLRVSITDRCNLRCAYCMPHGIEKVPMRQILTYEQIEEIVRAGAALGIRKVKVTGGEPLVRKGCATLIGMIRDIPGIEEVTLTTNGVYLKDQLPDLIDAGLSAVNVSLDTLSPEKFREITGTDALGEVKEGIEAALQSGLRVKVNCVLQKNVNDVEWPNIAMLAKNHKLDVRFIEMMPIGYGKEFDPISNAQLLVKMQAIWPDLIRDSNLHGNGPALYYHIPGWEGSIGLISPIHGKFCGSCNRLRLTSTGKLKPCLCYGTAVDLRPILKEEDSAMREQDLQKAFREAVFLKPKEHCFEEKGKITEKHKMSDIGG